MFVKFSREPALLTSRPARANVLYSVYSGVYDNKLLSPEKTDEMSTVRSEGRLMFNNEIILARPTTLSFFQKQFFAPASPPEHESHDNSPC